MYYTEEDRKRAAASRQRNQQFRELMKSPEDFYDIMGVSVPRVTTRPTLEEYGLTPDVEERLKHADDEYVQREKSSRKLSALVITAALIGLFFWFMNQGSQTAHPENYTDGRLTNNFIAWGGAVSSLGGMAGIAYAWGWATSVKPKQTYEHQRLGSYKQQLSYYDYWQRKQSKNHWNRMDGHSYEQAIANVFRDIGFTAEVSKRGGDGGVDIVLRHGQRTIAVQCKRYKSAVGPHVARDLWGTMHHLGYEEGCIVTTTGFTKGVQDFVHGKNIRLIDLNDILRSTGDNGSEYLRRKMGM